MITLPIPAALRWRLSALVRPPVSLGVRLVVRGADDTVVLVRHTYTGGWHVPGGGVDVGETVREAAVRECREETGLEIDTPLSLVGVYFNRGYSRRDHVVTFVTRPARPLAGLTFAPQALEIAEVIAAPLGALPADTTDSTRQRLAEAFEGAAPEEDW